jgi:hypothetical protein
MQTSKFIALSAALGLALGSLTAAAEEPVVQTTKVTDPARIDRDGKKICGFDLMNDSEKGGYKNMMHQTKSLADRDEIRVDHCARMKARAKERGVPAEE